MEEWRLLASVVVVGQGLSKLASLLLLLMSCTLLFEPGDRRRLPSSYTTTLWSYLSHGRYVFGYDVCAFYSWLLYSCHAAIIDSPGRECAANATIYKIVPPSHRGLDSATLSPMWENSDLGDLRKVLDPSRPNQRRGYANPRMPEVGCLADDRPP